MNWPSFLVKAFLFFGLPHVWISGSLAITLCYRGWKLRVWPSERQMIELLAYGAGMYGGVSLIGASVVTPPPGMSGLEWSLVAGGAVLALASVRGAWSVILNPAGRPREVVAPTEMHVASSQVSSRRLEGS